ncbi:MULTISPECIES: hypothetical protein [unclassified Okeania]|uniref:hypothetical protein n=1 Tax=unclassified Okeania TaxID=2634635 RepID=UPI002580DE88|nr:MULTISPECIES: hypothetical protein [unclassified Okeania]
MAALLVDTAISMHDKMMGKLFRRSENQHNQKFQQDGKLDSTKFLVEKTALVN